MFSPEEITRISMLFAEGLTPEEVAKELRVGPSLLRYRLTQSGYRIRVETTRELERIEAVEPAKEQVPA